MLRARKLRKLIQKGDNEKIEKMLSRRPKLAKAKTKDGISLLQFAAYCRNQIAAALFHRFKKRLSLFEAVSIGNLELVKGALDRNPARISEYSADGFTPLGLSAYFGHLDLVTMLLQRGADPNVAAKNSYKVTPLHSAVAISNYEVTQLLLKHGADVNTRQMRGVTALHSAAHNGDVKLVALLLENGADVNAAMDSGETPLAMAQAKGSRKVITLIKNAGGK